MRDQSGSCTKTKVRICFVFLWGPLEDILFDAKVVFDGDFFVGISNFWNLIMDVVLHILPTNKTLYLNHFMHIFKATQFIHIQNEYSFRRIAKKMGQKNLWREPFLI